MLGTVLLVDEGAGTGVIRADDGKRYRFNLADIPSSTTATTGQRIDFEPEGDFAAGPIPVSEAIAGTPPLAAATPVAPTPLAGSPLADTAPAGGAGDALPASEPVSEVPPAAVVPTPDVSPPPALEPAEPMMPPLDPVAAAEVPPSPRPISAASAGAPDYVTLNGAPVRPPSSAGSAFLWIGGAVLITALAGLAYMMADNAPGLFGGSEKAETATEENVTLFAQTDQPVRGEPAANGTVLGRLAAGTRVTGTIVPGSRDADSRWLRLSSGNRFVAMAGLGRTAPAAAAAAAPAAPLDDPAAAAPTGKPGVDAPAPAAEPAAPAAPVAAPPRPVTPRPAPRPAPEPEEAYQQSGLE